jgi:hypothetical protein
MYRRDGQPMPEHEEGAAFFKPIAGPEAETGQIWGVQKNLLTHGFNVHGLGVPAIDPNTSMISDEEAALRSGAETLPEVRIEGQPMGGAEFYESSFWRLLAVAGMAVGAYHGYKRNNSVGWGIGWGLLGGLVPIIVIPIALAQGIGKPKGRS